MKDHLKTLSSFAMFLLLIGFLYYHHQQQPSAQFKKLVVAMCDPYSSPEDVGVYLREARLEVKTDADRRILAEIDLALEKSASGHSTEENIANLREVVILWNEVRVSVGVAPVPVPEVAR